VWIITVKWEEYPPASGRDEILPLIHICAIAFDQKTSKEVGFATLQLMANPAHARTRDSVNVQ